jgi:methylase of polypeptide subunit release factors
MNLVPIIQFQNDPIITIDSLTGNLKIKHQEHMNGGGTIFRIPLLHCIKKYGKSSYNRGLEWCSGPGFLGYELLDANIANHMSFYDYYEKSIDFCKETAIINFIEEKVSTFVSSTIGGLPNSDKWDLVIGNPPHSWNLEEGRTSLQNAENRQDDVTIENMLRILVDDNMETHKEFFSNIRPRLTSDADLFIIEHDHSKKEIYKNMAEEGGLCLINVYPFESENYETFEHKIYHFKVNS